MTIADQIDSYLRAILATIRQGATVTLLNGSTHTFLTDIGCRVEKHQEYAERADERPYIVLFTGKNSSVTDDTVECGSEKHLQDISVEAVLDDDKAGAQGDAAKADLATALKSDPWFGGLIDELQGFETDVDIQVGDEIFSIVRASFTAMYFCPYGSE